MKNCKFLVFIFFVFPASYVNAQKVLPGITVKNFSGKIVVSWQNNYNIPVSNILIQRSYDSLKNYTTIGSVLNPQSTENGYADANPPYTKMYYRLSVSFEGGTYVITSPARPVKDIPFIDVDAGIDSMYPWQLNAGDSASSKNGITYPSQRIYTSKDNNIVVHLEDASSKKYSAKFFNENDSLLFELTKLTDEYLIIEKVNFGHTGWFHFEIYENGELIEKNKFQIGKEVKVGR